MRNIAFCIRTALSKTMKAKAGKTAGLYACLLYTSVPGGFGGRGVEGKIYAAQYAREKNIPFLGICLGMQVAVIEYARHVLGYADADSGEFNEETAHAVIDLMPDQYGVEKKGGTMRLGAYPCKIVPDSILQKAYGKDEVSERHRHRYEFNNCLLYTSRCV